MTASAKTSMVDTAVRILAEEGYQATSFSAVLARSGAPRGSIYHHFPGGKDELIELALNTHAERTFAHLGQLRGSGPEDIVRAFTGAWRQGLIHTDFAVGCSLLAVTASAGPGQLRDRTGELFRDWRALLAELLEAGGVDQSAAAGFAAQLLAAVEGAVAISRAEHSIEVFDVVAVQLVSSASGLPRVPS